MNRSRGVLYRRDVRLSFKLPLAVRTIYALGKLAGTKRANAKKAAQVLRKSQADYILVVREARKPKSNADQEPQIITADETKLVPELTLVMAANPTANIVIVPIGAKFADIEKRIAVLYGE